MPPIRSLPITATKPVKTERSHEENQERAYIAASRRSDRSLEARVESARRASEIHKRRTGRSLRVTEQDVVNEEMYEEEDDDLPAQYRRLTAHLNTSSSDFNRRLATYLTNHVAMRQALDQAMQTSYGHNGQQWNSHNQQMSNSQMFSNPAIMGQGFQPNPTNIQPSMMHRQAPSMPMYQTPSGQYTGDSASRTRPASMANAHPMHASTPATPAMSSPSGNFCFAGQRAASDAASAGHGSRSPTVTRELHSSHRANSDTALANVSAQANLQGNNSQSNTQDSSPHNVSNNHMQQSAWSGSPSMMSPMSPLTTQLPPNAQMFFDQGFNPSSDSMAQQPFYSYNYNPNINMKKTSDLQVSTGMSSTLAPPAFDTKDQTAWPTPPSSEELVSPFTATGDANYGVDAMFDFSGQQHFGGFPMDGQLTPHEDWEKFIDTTAYDDNTSPSAAA